MPFPVHERGEMPAWLYLLIAPALLLSENLAVFLAFRAQGVPLVRDETFWLLPVARLTDLPSLQALDAALLTLFFLLTAWVLAIVSLRRAARSRMGFTLAAFTLVPGLKIVAVASLAVLPIRGAPDGEGGASADPAPDKRIIVAHVVQGALTGVAMIVLAVLVSALTFGAYGWGLFVLTPFTTGMTTAYLANREVSIGGGRTIGLVLAAAALGCVALIALALEGIVCLILAAPLGGAMAMAGGIAGLQLAKIGHRRGRPLLTVAFLPAVFLIEAAMPPTAPIVSRDSIDIAAPPANVWRALTSNTSVAEPPGLVGRAGLAYAIGARIASPRVGGERIGYFSTGVSHERITQWAPGRRLAFIVLRQPPAMEEMSPYRRVHAPHVNGYFDTGTMQFDLVPLAAGRTQLTIRTDHVLRIDPIPYWEPLARWAIHRNSQRVLDDIRAKAERGD